MSDDRLKRESSELAFDNATIIGNAFIFVTSTGLEKFFALILTGRDKSCHRVT
jgi:hypothetical protein